MKSILLILAYVFLNSIELIGAYYKPTIWVSDINFGMVKAGDKPSRPFTILNNGCEDLIITGIKFLPSADPAFQLSEDFGKIDSLNPLVIPGLGFSQTFNVGFNPIAAGTFSNEVIFESNANLIYDNTLKLKGVSVNEGLTANSYDWGRVRIHRDKFPAGPYGNDYATGLDRAIMLKNSDSAAVTIISIDVKVIKGKSESFLFNQNDFSITLMPGEKRLVNVEFQPRSIGEHEIELILKNSAGREAVSVLKGIGIVPRISTYIEDFGSLILGKNEINKKSIKINNLNYEWADSLTITGFAIEPESGSISTDISGFGSEGFRFDLEQLQKGKPGGKIILRPCEALEFEAEFQAQREGTHHARLKTVSDAEQEGVSVWIGLGVKSLMINEMNEIIDIGIMPQPAGDNNAVLKFKSDKNTYTEIKVFNSIGQFVLSPFSGELEAGNHEIQVDCSGLTSGIYTILLKSGSITHIGKLMILK